MCSRKRGTMGFFHSALFFGILVLGSCSDIELQIEQIGTPASTKLVSGENLVFSYHRNEVEYMLQGGEGKEVELHDLYNIIRSEDSENIIKIQVLDGYYLYVNPETKVFNTTRIDSEASTFFVAPLPSSDRFHLHELSSGSGLVTNRVRTPFSFHLQSRYPDEPLAEFSLSEVTIKELYGNDQAKFNITLSLARKSVVADKAESYAQLLETMELNSHIKGAEIFILAKYIVEDFGIESEVFRSLPSTVQLLYQGIPLNLYINEYAMKYSWATDLLENIKPYTFTQHEASGLWSITYSSNRQWG